LFPDYENAPSIFFTLLRLVVGIVGHVIFFLLNILLHEWLHGIGFHISCQGHWNDNIKIGVLWSSLTPYCTCKKPLSAYAYLFGIVLPLLILGFGIYFISLYLGIRVLLYIGLMNILFAGGDILIALMLINCRPKLVLDHPTRCGFFEFVKEGEEQ
jgi:hypothetical protein